MMKRELEVNSSLKSWIKYGLVFPLSAPGFSTIVRFCVEVLVQVKDVLNASGRKTVKRRRDDLYSVSRPMMPGKVFS